MSNYYTGYYPGMTPQQVAQQDEIRQKAWMKRQAIRRMECIKYEVNNETKFRKNNINYLTPLERKEITIKQYQQLKNHDNAIDLFNNKEA